MKERRPELGPSSNLTNSTLKEIRVIKTAADTYFSPTYLSPLILSVFAQEQQRPLWREHNSRDGLKRLIFEESGELKQALLDYSQQQSQRSQFELMSEIADVLYLTVKYCLAEDLDLAISSQVFATQVELVNLAKQIECSAQKLLESDSSFRDYGQIISATQEVLETTLQIAVACDIAPEEALIFKLVRNQLKYPAPWLQQGEYQQAIGDSKFIWDSNGGDGVFIDFWSENRAEIQELVDLFSAAKLDKYNLIQEDAKRAVEMISVWWAEYYRQYYLQQSSQETVVWQAGGQEIETEAKNETFWNGEPPDLILIATSSLEKIKALSEGVPDFETNGSNVDVLIDDRLTQMLKLGTWRGVPVLAAPSSADVADNKHQPERAAQLKARAVAALFPAGQDVLVIATENFEKVSRARTNMSGVHYAFPPQDHGFSSKGKSYLLPPRPAEQARVKLDLQTGLGVIRTNGDPNQNWETAHLLSLKREVDYAQTAFFDPDSNCEVSAFFQRMLDQDLWPPDLMAEQAGDELVKASLKDCSLEEKKQLLTLQVAGLPWAVIEYILSSMNQDSIQ